MPVFKTLQYKENYSNKADGVALLKDIKNEQIKICFFDPQYRGVLDKLKYGNEGKGRGSARCELQQMSEELIKGFIKEIDRVLLPSGYLFLWIDKFHLCQGINEWYTNTSLQLVDLIVWDKKRMGMGYRSRRQSEYLVVLQKAPIKAKVTWTNHAIPDVWSEKITDRVHTHQKPLRLQMALIEATTVPGDYVLDPAAGSFSVLAACKQTGRNFVGGDIDTGIEIKP